MIFHVNPRVSARISQLHPLTARKGLERFGGETLGFGFWFHGPEIRGENHAEPGKPAFSGLGRTDEEPAESVSFFGETKLDLSKNRIL